MLTPSHRLEGEPWDMRTAVSRSYDSLARGGLHHARPSGGVANGTEYDFISRRAAVPSKAGIYDANLPVRLPFLFSLKQRCCTFGRQRTPSQNIP